MIIYYGESRNNYVEPFTSLSGSLSDSFTPHNAFLKCPAFTSLIKNTFVVRSNHDYEIQWDKEKLNFKSSVYDQIYFNKYLNVRNIETGLISYLQPNIFLFAEKSLEMELFPAFMHNTLNRHTVIPGKYNIGKHFRKLECAIQFFHSDTIKIKENDALYYIRFLTDEKIEFKRFMIDEKSFQPLINYFIEKRKHVQRILPLKWYYDRSIREKILKEIKNNLF